MAIVSCWSNPIGILGITYIEKQVHAVNKTKAIDFTTLFMKNHQKILLNELFVNKNHLNHTHVEQKA